MKLLEIAAMMDIKQYQQKLMKQESGISVNEQLAEELHTPVIKKDRKNEIQNSK